MYVHVTLTVGFIGHTENFCSDKFESNSASSKKKWGVYLRAENNYASGGHKEASKWLVGGRSKNFGCRKEEGTTINDNQSSHSMAFDGYGISNHKIYGSVKVGINAESRVLTFFKFMECQRSDETRLVRWWTEIDPAKNTSGGSKKEEVKTNKFFFASNLTKSD
jgi:ribonuclease BN (tRNA processing enzyme)